MLSHSPMILDQINWNLWKQESFQSTKEWSKTTVEAKEQCQCQSEVEAVKSAKLEQYKVKNRPYISMLDVKQVKIK